jgi:hypothetical protein
MEKMKFLTGDIYAIDVDSQERVHILKLRALIPRLTKGEVMSLVIVLVHSHSLRDGRWTGVEVSISALRGFSQDLAGAVLLISAISPSTKLAIAIELLATRSKEEYEHEEDKEL